MSLQDKLNNLDKYPMHMPGHKRNAKFRIPGSEIDVTEIDGLDNLHNPTGVLRETEQKLGRIYSCRHSHMLVNGSSVGLMAAIMALCNEGDTIIIARNCHKSVYNACIIRRLKVVFIHPKWNVNEGYYTRPDSEEVRRAIAEHPQAKAVVITSPTYEGNICDIGECAVPLIVDAAHGAHLGISYFPAYPKGDIVVSSLHKTLPALTQTAVCNVYNDELEPRVRRYLDMLQTSSPSYVLMNSVDICCDYILSNRAEFDRYYGDITALRSEIELEHLALKFCDDPSKIVISTVGTSISGTELAEILRNEYGIEAEMAAAGYIILMTSIGDDKQALDALRNALEDIDSRLEHATHGVISPPDDNGIWVAADIHKCDATAIDQCVGRIAAEFVMAYPPDVPIIMPNRVITDGAVKYIKAAVDNGVNIVSDSQMIPNSILTKAID